MANTSQSIRTARNQVRYLGSAHSGTREVWHMRLTSLALLPLTIGFVWLLISLLGKNYGQVREILARPLPALILLLFVGAGIYHMKLGMQTIIEDYVHGAHTKEAALIANLFFCISTTLACVYAIFRISFV